MVCTALPGVLFGSLLLSFFIIFSFYLLLRAREQALSLSEQTIKISLENKKRFENLFESSNDAIVTLEPPDWKFTNGNPAAIKLFGAKDEKEFITFSPSDLSPAKQPDGESSVLKSKKMIDKAMREGSASFEWLHKKYKGENFLAMILLTKVVSGKKEFLQVTIRDISEQKKIEELEKKRIQEIEKMNSLMIGRELKMMELKKEIDKLKKSKN